MAEARCRMSCGRYSSALAYSMSQLHISISSLHLHHHHCRQCINVQNSNELLKSRRLVDYSINNVYLHHPNV